MKQNIELKKNSSLATKERALINTSPRLDARQKRVVEIARTGLKISNLKKDQVIRDAVSEYFSGILHKAPLISGWKSNAELQDQDRNTLIIEMIRVCENYTWLTLKELDFIVVNGLRGEWDDEENKSWALNARFLNLWIRRYENTIRREAFKEQLHYEETLIKEREREESERIYQESLIRNRELILTTYDELKKQDDFYTEDIVNDNLMLAYYQAFDEKGILKVDTKEKIDLFDKTGRIILGKYRAEQMKKGGYRNISDVPIPPLKLQILENKTKMDCRIMAMKLTLCRMAEAKEDLRKIFEDNGL